MIVWFVPSKMLICQYFIKCVYINCSDAANDVKKTREREQKWLKMITNWKDWTDNKSSRVSLSLSLLSFTSFSQLKERCRKGIPDSLRGRAWLLLSGADELLEQNQGVFEVSTFCNLSCL